MSIIATTSGASAAAKESEVKGFPFWAHRAIKYKNNSSSLGLLGAVSFPALKPLSSRKVSQSSGKKLITQKDHMQLCLFTGKGAKPRSLSCVQIFSKRKS
ncbi:MAG: hypothetical protein LBB16_01890 [Puniceicoccales bacterium]|jgi:hypothetical protein|nr:hypothetical protein [Puniceicoccales bacterium]